MESNHKAVKIAEGSYGCYIHYRVNPSLLESPEIQLLTKEVPGRYFESLHLSMSKSFQLPYTYVDPFLSKLRKSLNKHECLNIPLILSSCSLLNERFLAFGVRDPTKSKLSGILHKIDTLMEQYGFDKYYSPPIFHVSIAECDVHKIEGIDLSKYPSPKISTILTELFLQVGQKLIKIW